jgi:gluconolactonase
MDARGTLFFSDQPNDRVMRLSADGDLAVFREPCGRVNGLMLDNEGRLVMCQSDWEDLGGGRQVSRLELDGSETVLAATFEGSRFIAPNDLTIDRKGRIYFTDPYYGPPHEKSQPSSGVYRIDSVGVVYLVISDLERPNGIVITPDNRHLLVSDRGTQKLHRYQVLADASLQHESVVYDFSPDRGIDGMWLDQEGNVYGAAGQEETAGLYVISPHGELLQFIRIPEYSTNVTFGGQDLRNLYFTSGTSVYMLRTNIAGMPNPLLAASRTD